MKQIWEIKVVLFYRDSRSGSSAGSWVGLHEGWSGEEVGVAAPSPALGWNAVWVWPPCFRTITLHRDSPPSSNLRASSLIRLVQWDGYSYLYRRVAFPPLIFFSSWCLVLGWRAKATFEHKSGFFILCGGKPGAFAELKTEIKPLKVDCMCPATHILFWLLTFLRLKIYLEPLVPLFFRGFISYSFKYTVFF